MTPRGTIPINRRFGRLGELRIQSGTKDRELWRRLNGMLTTLHESRRDVLEAVIAKRLTPLEVWQYFRVGRLGDLPLAPEGMLPLVPTMGRWIDELRRSDGRPATERHRQSLRESLDRLAKHGDTVEGLPAALVAARREILPAHPRTYMLTKAAAQAFLRDLDGIGKAHPLYLAVTGVPSVLVKPNQRGGLPIADFRKMLELLSPIHRAQAWAMAGTGMGPDEYLGRKFEVLADRVAIHGTKRDARERVVPFVVPVTGPHTRYRALWGALHKVGVEPYDLRRSFMHWMEESGIPRTRRKLYMGHNPAGEDVSGRYEFHSVIPYLPVDGAALRKYIGDVKGVMLEARA